MTYAELEARIVAWAATRPDIRAVIAVGSYARGDADRWSDLDLLLFTPDRAHYADPGWLHTFGEVWLTYLDEAAPGDPEWFAIYDGGLKLDVVLLQVEDGASALEELLPRYHYQTVFARGVKVLFDQRGQARSLPPKAIDQAAPSSSAFEHEVNGFLVESVTTAKFIARGDFWRAQYWLANDLRPRLLKLMEWHAYGQDTWYNGRFLDSWADPRGVAALPGSFALYERESLRAALGILLDLFLRLGEETADHFRFSYPTATHRKIARMIETVLAAG